VLHLGLEVGGISIGLLRLDVPFGVHELVETVCERFMHVVINTSLDLVFGRRPEFTDVLSSMVVVKDVLRNEADTE
jgi:hypothetical protein